MHNWTTYQKYEIENSDPFLVSTYLNIESDFHIQMHRLTCKKEYCHIYPCICFSIYIMCVSVYVCMCVCMCACAHVCVWNSIEKEKEKMHLISHEPIKGGQLPV